MWGEETLCGQFGIVAGALAAYMLDVTEPTLTFVVIAFNEEQGIEESLQSILRLDSLPANFEVVVIDDGSTDGTCERVRSVAGEHPAVRLVRTPNGGRGHARAAGVDAARATDLIAFVDADIVLPKHWLVDCRRLLLNSDLDAVGGVAVPDGDVAYVHRAFGLVPKPVSSSTAVTGNNGLFRRSVFDRVRYDSSKRNGEDVDLVHQMHAAGLEAQTLTDVRVEHREAKTYSQSVLWLFESGRGATRQFFEHPEWRLPDVAFAGFALSALAGATSSRVSRKRAVGLALPVAYVAATAAAHLRGRFELARTPVRSAAAVAVNSTLMLAYYAGRLDGLVSQRRYR